MSYIIRRTNGVSLGTILDGTVDTAQTSLTLVGRNYANYGQIMTNNLVSLLENFSSVTPPSNPLSGQLWWNDTDQRLRVYTGTDFKIISSATSATIGPTTTIAGDIWWDSTNEQLYVYNGTIPYNAAGWILVGPTFKKPNGKSGAIWEVIYEGTTPHNVVSMYLDGVRTGVVSQDTTFTPSPAISGFTTIAPGYNMATGSKFTGTSSNADQLGGVVAANYLRTDTNNRTTGNLQVVNDDGVTIGAGLDLALTVDGVDASITNRSTGGDLSIYATVDSSLVRAVYINGATGEIEVAADPTSALGIATKSYVEGKFVDSALTGIPTAPTAAAETATTQLATTEFVINNSGFLKNKIYQNNTYVEVLDAGLGSANLVVDGVSVLTASSSGVSLKTGATAVTQSQTYNGIGDNRVATTSYVKTAAQWWGGSAKFVSPNTPDSGSGNDGDFWFQYTT